MPDSRQKVVIIIPTYNEKENVKNLTPVLCDQIFPEINQKYDMHVLYVDDSSPDKTADEIKKLQKKYKNVHLLLNKKKAGLGGAYIKGMTQAINELQADIVFEFDADFSHDPKKIGPILKKMEEGYDIVIGSRYIPGGKIPDNWGIDRKFFSVFGNFVIRVVLTDFRVADWTGGYRAIKKDVVNAILPHLNNKRFTGYTFQIGFLHKAVRSGYKVGEVPIHFIDRTYGESKLGSEYIKNTLIYIFKVRIQEILEWRIFKFVVTGGIGAVIQLITLSLYRRFMPYQLAFFLAIETAVASNFVLSNLWTFADRKLKAAQIPSKFVQFNLASAGSIIIQQAIAVIGQATIGLVYLFTVPVIHAQVDTGMMYAIIGILVGMFWNFFAYSKIIWRQK